MTPEERARVIVDPLDFPRFPGYFAKTEQTIAAAIRDAEAHARAEAFEEAARIVEAWASQEGGWLAKSEYADLLSSIRAAAKRKEG